jgi:hypothetical protein
MHAYRFDDLKSLDDLRRHDEAMPEPQRGEVLWLYTHDDMVAWDGAYYGDFSLFIATEDDPNRQSAAPWRGRPKPAPFISRRRSRRSLARASAEHQHPFDSERGGKLLDLRTGYFTILMCAKETAVF